MPWKAVKRKCKTAEGEEGNFAVVKSDTDEEVGCHKTMESAEAHVKALYANAGSEEKGFLTSVFKTVQPKKQIVFAEVYAPGIIDSHGDMMLSDQIEKAAHRFIRAQLTDRVDIMHDNRLIEASVVESFIARENDPDFLPGAWVVGIKVDDSDVWRKIEDGELNGFSFEAFVKKIPATVEIEYDQVVAGETAASDDHSHAFAVEIADDGGIVTGGTSKEAEHTHEISRYVMTEKAKGHSHRFAVH